MMCRGDSGGVTTIIVLCPGLRLIAKAPQSAVWRPALVFAQQMRLVTTLSHGVG